MYGRNRYSRYRGNWYQSAFWLVVGILVGQFFRFNITFEDSERTQIPPKAQPTLQANQND